MNLISLFDQEVVSELKSQQWKHLQAGSLIEAYTLDKMISEDEQGIVLLSVGNKSDEAFLKEIRKSFYGLFLTGQQDSFSDAGHFIGELSELPLVLARLRDYGSIPVLLCSDQSLTYFIYQSYCLKEQTVNLISIDDHPDLEQIEDELGEQNWLTHLISHTPNYLFNYSLIGYQTYLSNPEMLNSLSTLNFDLHRLGKVRQSPTLIEPYFRNADFLSVDVSAIRASDCPGSLRQGPNGLYAEEACQLMRYAGMSNKLTQAGVFGWKPGLDKDSVITASLIAQMLWHFADGVIHRIPDGKIGNQDEYLIYKVSSEHVEPELIFYKNNRNGRWWMNVPMNEFTTSKFSRHHVVPCSYEDYLQAMKGEIPETWWQTYQKLS
jgi:formiminoglutamase